MDSTENTSEKSQLHVKNDMLQIVRSNLLWLVLDMQSMIRDQYLSKYVKLRLESSRTCSDMDFMQNIGQTS